MISSSRQSGFSLLEVLVALAVVAIALAAVGKAVNSNLSNAGHLTEKTLAHWMALNKMNELHLSKEWLPVGSRKGNEIMAEQEWVWEMVVKETEVKSVRQVDVLVGKENDADTVVFSMLTGYIFEP